MKKTIVAVLCCGVVLGAPELALARSTIGGIVFVDTYRLTFDDAASETGEDLERTRIELPSITRLRGLWTNEDDVEMFVELGIGGESGDTGVNLRHAFGKWDFSTTGQLLAGHSTSPFSPLFPSQAIGNNAEESFNVGKGYGEVSSGRAPQVRYTYKLLNSRGALAIALLDPNRDDEIEEDLDGVSASDLPRIDVGFAYRAFNWQIFPGFFFQEKQFDAVSLADDRVTSWGTSVGIRGGHGPFLLSAEINLGENMRNANLSIGQSVASITGGAFLFTDGSGQTRIGDTENLSWWVDGGIKFTHDELQGTVHLVVGEMTSERQDGPSAEFESRMFGISAPIDLPWIAKGLRFRPEIFVYVNDNNGNVEISTKDGTQILGGLQLQYTF